MRQGAINGRRDDLVSKIEFDEKTKKFKQGKPAEQKSRNMMEALIDVVFFSVRENMNDKYDKLFLKVLKVVLNIIGFNLFSLKINAYKTLFDNAVKMYSTARTVQGKAACKNVMIRLFDSLTMRLRLQNQLFNNSANPTSFFYNSKTKALIQSETESVLSGLVDRVVAETELRREVMDGRLVLDLEKPNVFLGVLDFGGPEKKSDSKLGSNLETELGTEKGEGSQTTAEPQLDKSSTSIQGAVDQAHQPGLFGFCHVCRRPARFYCKEYRMPICSFECKLRNTESVEHLSRSFAAGRQAEREELSIHGAYLELFVMLSEKCFDKRYEKDRTCYLDVLLSVFRGKNMYLQTDRNFINFLKTEIFPNILKIAIASEDQILRTCLIIFLNFVMHFRRYLLREIGVFIQDIFMEILESPNSKFIVKFYILQVLTNLIEKESIPFELFLNFDCRENSSNLLERTVDLLVKIAQGKYVKSIYAGMINATDEEQLQQEAIQAIVRLIRSSWSFLEQTSKARGVTAEAPRNLSAVLDKKRQIDEAIQRFNVGKKNSLKVLIELGVVPNDTPEALSEFLRTDKRVTQGIIGEILGGDDEFNLKVLADFMKNVGLKGRSILQALKHTLSLFELPGEGQKVERILESFSKEYAVENPELSEDAAYLLVFLLMMCHTSLYNPQVTEKMTLQKYLQIGKEIKNNGEPVSQELLTGYYNEIVAAPLAVHALEKRRQEIANAVSRSAKQKQDLFKLESEKMFETLNSKIQAGDSPADYQMPTDASTLQVFLATIWTNLLAFFSTVIANCEKTNQLRGLVDSCVLMIRICDHFNMQTERDSFVNLLVQFSGLEKTFNQVFDEKNLLFMNAVLLIASKLGNHLHRGWTFVLNCVIALNFHHFQADRLKGALTPNQVLTVDEQNALFVAAHFPPESLSNVFIDSSKLDEHSVIDFINGLCALALKEMEKNETRFCYILEQVVYVSYENQYRNPIEWLRIWDIYDKLFEEVLNKSDVVKQEVVEFAIDTLQKLIACSFKVRLQEQITHLTSISTADSDRVSNSLLE